MPAEADIPSAIRAAIADRLSEVARVHDVRTLLAVESGSRAWGFPSRDSDYDVRFIYVHRPEWYLAVDIERRRDVIELPITAELDITGWDLRKALALMARSNPPLLEWIGSPVVYAESLDLRVRLQALLPAVISPASLVHHYLSMARGNHREYLKGETVRAKKYLYVLRPLLAIRWIEAGRGPAPTVFRRLLETIADRPDLLEAIHALVQRKRAGDELDGEPADPVIASFIEAELARLEGHRPSAAPHRPDMSPINALFRALVAEAWSHAPDPGGPQTP